MTVLNLFYKRKIFFISDLHLDHANIIKYCKRPFGSVEEMNRVIVENWNSAVGKKDTVYFLGDMSYGKGSRGIDYWAGRLNGKIIFIKGSHDMSERIKFHDKLIVKYKDKRFLLVHDPKNIPEDWKGWVIHGHHHNNYPEYPLVDKKKKTINVSVEMLDYKPLSLEDLLKLIG